MDRYIATEFIPLFLFSVGLFSCLGVTIGTLSDLTNKVFEFNLPLQLALKVFLLKIPEFTAYALPISVLLASLMAYSRLSSDSELIALRSCGISLYRLVLPAVLFSLLVTGITFFLNELVVPAANYQATAILQKALPEDEFYSRPKNYIFYPEYETVVQSNVTHRRLKSLFYADSFDGQRLQDLTVLNWSTKGLKQIIISQSARWNSQQEIWDFFNGTIYDLRADAGYDRALSFTHQQLPLSSAAFDFVSKYRDPYEMNIAQAVEYMEILRSSGDDKKLMMFRVRTHQKISFPFVCLVFSLVGTALGCRPQQGSRATSFGICVGVVFAYYLLGFIIGGFGIAGILSPFMAAWLPNFFGLGVGGWLLIQSARCFDF